MATAIVDAAWESGVRYFDTAPHYGLGLSERRLGQALRSRPRGEYLISTKVGRLLRPGPDKVQRRVWDFSREGVLASLRESLGRLGLDRADIVLLHDPHESGQLSLAFGEGLEALLELRREGVIQAVGVGSGDVPSLERFATQTPIDVILLASRYTLLDQRAAQSLLGRCAERGVRVLNAGVYSTGILASDEPSGQQRFDYRRAPMDVVERARAIARVCREFGVRVPTAALQFSFTSPAVRAVVVGAETPGQVSETARLLRSRVPEELWARLRSQGLISA